MNIMLGHAKQIVLSNLHNIHKLPNIFDLTYICLEEKLVILWRTYFQRLELILSDSSGRCLKRKYKLRNNHELMRTSQTMGQVMLMKTNNICCRT